MHHRMLSISLVLFAALLLNMSSNAQMPKDMLSRMMAMKMKSDGDSERLYNYGDAPAIYALSNGMEVMLIENHSSPVIASTVVVRVGLRNETIELNGVSHFLEHLLFNGTETRTQKQLYDEMDFLGGYNNANTTHDHTNYMILLEKSNFEKGLEIQADMLFHSILPPDKFEKEKGIVIEEIGMGEDRESERAERFFDQVIFKGTPYQWPILGSCNSIKRMNRDQVLEYYKTYYVPNNMVALIIGDFHTPDMIELVNRTFGETPPQTLPGHKLMMLSPFRLDPHDGETLYVQQGTASNHQVRFSLFAPTRRYPDFYAFRVMVELMSDHLDQSLTTSSEFGITSVSVNHFVDLDFGLLNVDLTLDPSVEYEPAVEALQSSLKDFKEKVIEPEKITAVVTAIRSGEIFNSERPHFYGMLKSEDLAQGGPYFLLEYLDRLEAVTRSDVVQAMDNYLNPDYAIVAVYLAVGAGEDTGEEVAEKKTISKQLPNGLLAVVQENHDNPIFAAHFLFKHRSAYETELGGKPGMVDFLHHMLDYGPLGMDREAFQAELQKYGARVKFYDMAFIPYDDYYTTPEFSYVRLEALDDNFAPVLDLLARTLMDPSIAPEVIEPVRGQMIMLAEREQASVSKSGRALFRSLLYGESPLAGSIVGSPEDIANFTAEELQNFARRYFSPRNLILTVLTGNDADSVLAEIGEIFGSWSSGSDLPVVSIPRPEVLPQREEQPGGKEQSYLAMGYIFNLDDPSHRAPLAIANVILSERMQFQLREKEGLAYSLGSSVSFHDNWGVWAASMGTSPQNLKRAEEGILDQLRKAAKGKFTDHDVGKARNAYLGRLAMRGLTRINRAYLMGKGEFQGEGTERHQTWIQELRGVTADDVNRAARRYLKTNGMTTTILG